MVLAYLFASGYKIEPLKTAVFFLGMLCFDLTATMINNYCDTKKNQQILPFPGVQPRASVLAVYGQCRFRTVLSFTCRIWWSCSWACFASFAGSYIPLGRFPSSHGPYGEIISGFFYGLVIPAILFYINVPGGTLFSYALAAGKLSVVIEIRAATGLLLLSIVPFCLTANIMLANNICDVERDVVVGRYTGLLSGAESAVAFRYVVLHRISVGDCPGCPGLSITP